MCGIAGRFNYDPLRPVDRDVLVAMTDAVAHRGPDAAGYYLAPGIGLGHRRLSIIDLSTGDQPLANEDGTVQDRLQRRDLQLRRRPRRAGRARPPVPHRLRHRGHRPRLRGVGRALRRALPRHVRVRGLGRTRAPAAACARSARRQAAVLRGSARPRHRVRLRDQVAARGCRRSARLAPGSDRRVPDAALHPRARHDLPRRPQAPPGHILVAERGRIRVSRYWDLRVHRRRRRRARRGIPRAARRTAARSGRVCG